MNVGEKTLRSRFINRVTYIIVFPIVLVTYLITHFVRFFLLYFDNWSYDKTYDKLKSYNDEHNGDCTIWDYIMDR